MSVDKYLGKRYHPREYNCVHFVCEVWQDLLGQELSVMLHGFLNGVTNRTVALSQLRSVVWLDRPESPCVVFMQRKNCEPHVGLWIRGKVLHITPIGVSHHPLDVATYGFSRVRFFKC